MEGRGRKDICQQFSIGKDNLIMKSLQVNMQPGLESQPQDEITTSKYATKIRKSATRGFVTKSAKKIRKSATRGFVTLPPSTYLHTIGNER